MKFIELFAGIGGFRYGLEACNIESTYIGKKSEQEECPQRGEWAADERRVQLCSGDKPSLCSDDAVELGGCRQEEDKLETDVSNSVSQSHVRQQSFSCVYANEWDKYAASIYRRHYGSIDTRDITTVDVSDIPTHDLLTGGFPCQDYSIAGKGAGLDGSRGTLFFEIARILKHHQPRHFLLENVKGLLSNQDRRTFPYIISVLSDLGYRVESMVLNSKHFGVPQNRERVFIVGHLRGECRGQVFPIRETNGKALEFIAGGGIEQWVNGDGNLSRQHSQGQRVYSPDGVSSTLSSEGGGWGAKTGLYAVQNGVLKSKAVVNCLDANYYKGLDNHQARTGVVTGLYAMRGREDGQQLELRGNETNALTSVQKDNLWMEGTRIRRLTPTECERLQAFPDGWTDGISDTQRYKCLGNAVTTSVITAIGEGLLEHLLTQEKSPVISEG